MKFEELIILLPCHSLEDFPLYHQHEEADSLLGCYTTLWHPALLHCAGKLPAWFRADSPPEKTSDRLIMVPLVSESLLLAGWPARAKGEGACVVRKKHKRPELIAAALAELDGGDAGIDPDLTADFLALGFGYLQLELLVRRLRQYSNLDEVHLKNEVLAAAQAAVEKDTARARLHLQNCFDVLFETRERCFAAETYFLDLTLVADSTLGPELAKELQGPQPLNLLIGAGLLEQLGKTQPETLALVKEKYAANQIGIIGGETEERDLPLLPLESILWGLRDGRARAEQLLTEAPAVYGRRRYGLTPVLPVILSQAGFKGAAHFTLDDGQFPKSEQSRAYWEGQDTSVVDMLGRVPLDAQSTGDFLNLPEKLGDTMDLDHVATLIFAHWPGQVCEWYEDLRRVAKFSPVLGKFVTVKDYFAHTSGPGHNTKFSPDQYRAPYLKQAIIRRRANPMTAYADFLIARLQCEAAATLQLIDSTLTGRVGTPDLQRRIRETVTAWEHCAGPLADVPPAGLVEKTQALLTEAAEQLAKNLPRGTDTNSPGCLVFNPLSFARRVGVELPGWEARPAVAGPLRATQSMPSGIRALVDVPALGYAWIPRVRHTAPDKKPPLPLAEGTLVRNEFFEVIVDPQTGGIRSVHDYKQRANRLSQQLGFRLPGQKPKTGDVWQDPDLEAAYSKMVAEKVEVTANGSAMGEVTSRGELLDPEGKRLARFEQRVQAWLGSRVLIIDLKLEVEEQPKADPWNSYYAARFAWGDESADLYRTVNQHRLKTEAKRIESPYFVEVCTATKRTLLMSSGLPYHRRIGLRMLDMLLVSRGDTRQHFRMGIGLEVEHPLQASLNLLAPPPLVIDGGAVPTVGPSSWFFHIDRKNVLATAWDLAGAESNVPTADGLVTHGASGFTVRLLETEGRPGRVKLRCLHNVASAQQVDFLGQKLHDLTVEGDTILLDLGAYEWAQIQARWQPA